MEALAESLGEFGLSSYSDRIKGYDKIECVDRIESQIMKMIALGVSTTNLLIDNRVLATYKTSSGTEQHDLSRVLLTAGCRLDSRGLSRNFIVLRAKDLRIEVEPKEPWINNVYASATSRGLKLFFDSDSQELELLIEDYKGSVCSINFEDSLSGFTEEEN